MASPIYIVDPKTGNIRDPQVHDANGPFLMTNWFDGQQSVNIINSQRYVFATLNTLSAVNSIDVNLDLDSKFYFIDESKLGGKTQIDEQDFYDLKSLGFVTRNLTLSKTVVGDWDIWTVVVCLQAEEAGSYIDELSISLDGADPIYITIGADCYNEDETLTGNLQNMGVEFPSAIQKAIHTTNVHEDLNDNILLNRKKRELLMNYWNVVAGKGSYKSLIDSLKWFEYGDLVRIEQYWKTDVGGKEMFLGDDLETFLDDVLESELSYKIKTTYDGLYLLLDINDEGYDSELNPKTKNLDETVLLWTEKDLSLKMTLLGNFFSTYFMPIHLALLHSTIERRVYAYGLQLLSVGKTFRNDFFKANCPMSLTLHDKEPKFYLEDTEAYVYMETIFGIHNDFTAPTPPNDYVTEFIGVEPLREMKNMPNITDPNYPDNWLSADFSRNMFSGIGKVVQFDVNIPTEWTDPNDSIWKQTIYMIKDGDELKDSKTTDSYVTISPKSVDGIYLYDFSFYILFQNVGDYRLSVAFETLNGKTYTSTIGLTISDAGNCSLVPYVVERLPIVDNVTINLSNDILFNNFAFRNTDEPALTNFPLDPVFVTPSTNPDHTEIGLNHYIAFVINSNDFELRDSNNQSSVIGNIPSTQQDIENLINQLESDFTYYFWDGRFINDEDGNVTTNVLIRGLRKPYSIDKVSKKLIEENFTFLGTPIHYEITYDISASPVKFTISTDPDVITYVNGSDTKWYDGGIFEVDDLTEPVELEIVYNKISIYRTCKVLDCNTLYNEGVDSYKVHLYDNNSFVNQNIIDQDVFVPIFHSIAELTEPCKITQNQTVAIVPTFERSYELPNNSSANWIFSKRFGTQSISCIQNIASKEPFVAPYEPEHLDKGYWNAQYNIIQNGTNVRTINGNSLFKVE